MREHGVVSRLNRRTQWKAFINEETERRAILSILSRDSVVHVLFLCFWVVEGMDFAWLSIFSSLAWC